MLFKGISDLEVWQPFCSAERNNLCNFVQFYFEFGSVVQVEMSFKRFLIWSDGGPPAQWSGTSNAISKEGIMGYEIWTSGSRGDVV